MALREKLIYAIGLEVDGVKKGMASVRSEVMSADGVFGKFKAGGSAAFDAVANNAGMFAVGAGGAIAAFAAKSISAFTDTAKAAVDLHAATGLAIEDASRWIAVGDDYEVGAEQLTSGLGKIAKSLDSGKWEKYGIATRDAAGHARDANDILLDAFTKLSQTTNETERARIGNDLFGKGYANLAPLIGHTRAEYEDMLGSVEKGQVITDKEAAKAEKTRLAYDDLHDSVKDLSLAFGQELAPAAASAASGLAETIGMVLRFTDALKAIPGMPAVVKVWWDYFSPQAMLATNIGKVTGKVNDLGKAIFGYGGNAKSAQEINAGLSASYVSTASTSGLARGAADNHSASVAALNDRITQMNTAVDYSTTTLRWEAEAEDAATAATERRTAAINANREAESRRINASLRAVGGELGARAAKTDAIAAFNDPNLSFDEKLQAILGAANQIAAVAQTEAESQGINVSPQMQAAMLKDALGDFARLFGQMFAGDSNQIALGDAIADQLRGFMGEITTAVSTSTNGRGTVVNGVRYYAGGGIVDGPTGTPRLAVVHGGEEVLTPGQQRSGGAGLVLHAPINLTVHAGVGADGFQVGRHVVEILDNYFRQGGRFSQNTLRILRGADN